MRFRISSGCESALCNRVAGSRGQTYKALGRDFADELPEATAEGAYALQEPFQKVQHYRGGLEVETTFYAVSTKDRAINPDLERFVTKNMGDKTIEVKESHMLLISHPGKISGPTLEAAHGGCA